MRPHFLIIAWLLSSNLAAQAQTTLHDAMLLRIQVDSVGYFKDDEDSVTVSKPILDKYFENLTTDMSDNPYIGNDDGEARIRVAESYHTGRDIDDNPPSRNDPIQSSILPMGLGGLDVTYLADGLAKFLVKRTKEELTVTFFKRLQDAAETDPNLRGFFPTTCGILAHIGTEIYQYNVYIDLLREACIKDLKTIPTHLADFADTTAAIPFDYQRIFLQDGLTAMQMLYDAASPYDIFSYLANDAHIQYPDLPAETRQKVIDAASGIKIAFILSESLRKDQNNWYTAKEIRTALQDSVTLDLYLGLLWQQTEGIQFSNGKEVHTFLQTLLTAKDTLYSYRNYLCELGNDIQTLKKNYLDLAAHIDTIGTEAIQLQLHQQYLGDILQILADGAKFTHDYILSQTDTLLFNYVGLFQSINELGFDVRQRHYLSVIFNLAEIATYVGFGGEELDKMLKYGTFFATIAEADNADQVAQAIEAVAMPVGGSILKKHSEWSFEFNAYTGIAIGQEYLQNTDPGRFIAISAPVGINLSYGLDQYGSLSLFVPLIDVGALASFRFKDPTTTDLPKLSLNNIVAPGGYLVYGFGRDIPISVGIGGQLGPNLRQISSTQAEYASGWRIGGFLGVDIPIFRLYSR